MIANHWCSTRRLWARIWRSSDTRSRVCVAADQPVAKLALRLCEVTPEGKSWLVTYGLLNLTHRESHEQPAPLTRVSPTMLN